MFSLPIFLSSSSSQAVSESSVVTRSTDGHSDSISTTPVEARAAVASPVQIQDAATTALADITVDALQGISAPTERAHAERPLKRHNYKARFD